MKLRLTFKTVDDAKTVYNLLKPKFSVTYGSSMKELIIPPGDRHEILDIIKNNDISYTTG